MKKILIFAAVIVVIFGAIAIITNMQNESKTEGNPYGKEDLHPSTVELLDDPNYENQILPDDLEAKIESGEPTTVYFFAPDCQHCLKTTPMLSPLAEDMDVDMVKMNLREFDVWDQYNIQSTPTLVHFEDGKAVDGIVGSASESDYEDFFNRNVKQ
ncbi:thioredoxin [Jeotgalibacillus sp. S-D1]|uniref:thioredoxin family protein n=1 Tax=Jeotgalibacillus sp. S-D1 TaxID=2552189 RepID=UPI0010592EB6|nr:thioredoxin family protein [Jeotgalibacillus sp. S-D1]TDL35435.1 thioredoxin [Jeotgalibacillus sp. S-D1]